VTLANDDYSDADTEAVALTSTQDTDAIQTKVQSFLSTFNSTMNYLQTQMYVDTVTYTRGALAGDTTFRTLRTNMVTAMLDTVSGVGNNDPATLNEIGITFDDNFDLTISDEDTFVEYLTQDPSAVETLFNSTNGVATQLTSILEGYTDSDGIIEDRKDSIQERIGYLDDRIESIESRLEKRAEQYRNQLFAIQDLLYQAVSQQSLMNSLLSSTQSIFS
jgi:flagellar hook-associated protein 2